MIETEADFLKKLSQIVMENWQERRKPVLLSYVGTKLAADGIDYRQWSPDGKLASILKAHSEAFTYAASPYDALVAAVVPAGESFDWPEGGSQSPKEAASVTEGNNERLKRSRGALYAFVRELSRLPKSEADSVIIPTSVLIRLLEGR